MTKQLPASGPERLIFLEALTSFSDACRAPELTPNCPFYTVGSDGPVCGEQCKDLLGEHGGQRRSPGVTDLGDGFEVHRRRPRPRPRRGPADGEPAFDARQLYLADQERPRDSRSVASLIYELQERLYFGPPLDEEDRPEYTYEVLADVDELYRRGIDAERLVRQGLSDLIVTGVSFFALTDVMRAQDTADGQARTVNGPWQRLLHTSHADGAPNHWLDVDWAWLIRRMSAATFASRHVAPLLPPAESPAAEDDANSQALINYAVAGRFPHLLRRWVATAPLEDVLNWHAPDYDAFHAEGPEGSRAERGSDQHLGQWLVDRFSRTYLNDWALDSLKKEWQYLLGNCQGAAPADVMRTRRVRAEEVAATIADLVSKGDPVLPGPPLPTPPEMFKFVRVAVDSLMSGRREDAAALYRGLVQVYPRDPDVVNNYGFCLLADDPATALTWLNRAAALRGSDFDPTNAANRTFALNRLNQFEEALRVAEDLAERGTTCSAYLWLAKGEDWTLGEHVDALTYTAEQARLAAKALGDLVAAEKWADRLLGYQDRAAG